MNNFWKEHEKDVVIHANGKMNIVDSMERFASDSEMKSRIALSFEDENGKVEKYSYSELFGKVNQFANLLKEKGVKRGNKVAIFLGKCPEVYFCFLGAIKTGAIAMPLFEAFQSDGLELRLERGDVKFLVTNKELCERYNKIEHKIKTVKEIFIIDSSDFKKSLSKQKKEFDAVLLDKMETCLMMFTSSTAGTPVAGIELPHYGLVQQVYTAKKVLLLEKGENYWCTAHPAWVTGAIYGVVAPLAIGASVFVIGGRFDSKSWIKFMKKNSISKVYTAPTVLRLIKQDVHKGDFKQVKRLCSVGEALPQAIVDIYHKKGIDIVDTYWQTEIGSIVIANIHSKKGALGEAIGVNIAIRDGMMIIEKPWPSMMTGIYKHEKMYKDYSDGKWFKTNDLATKDKNGYFYFSGRKDDMIKTSGERVSPLEIENILLKNSVVREVAVIGIPDEVRGSIIKAFVVLNEGIEASDKLKEELSLFVKSRYAGHAYPKIVEFVKSLPKNNAGKIVRMKLRENKK